MTKAPARRNISVSTQKMARTAILIAIMLLMAFTPIGYLRTGGIEITFMMIPVFVGATLLGPAVGALLGGVFGFTSFIQCINATSPFGAMLLSIDGINTFILCMAPRILMGFLVGVIFLVLRNVLAKISGETKVIPFSIASLSGAILNTSFFMSGLMILFGRSDYITEMRAGRSILAFFIWFVGLNGALEAVVCFVVGTALSSVLAHFLPPLNTHVNSDDSNQM